MCKEKRLVCPSCSPALCTPVQHRIEDTITVSHLLILKIIFFFHRDFPSGYKHLLALEPPSQFIPCGALSITRVASKRGRAALWGLSTLWFVDQQQQDHLGACEECSAAAQLLPRPKEAEPGSHFSMLVCSSHNGLPSASETHQTPSVSWPFMVLSARHVFPLSHRWWVLLHHLGFTQMLLLQGVLRWPPHTTYSILFYSLYNACQYWKMSLLKNLTCFFSLSFPRVFPFFPYYFLYWKTPLPFPFFHRCKHSNGFILYLFIRMCFYKMCIPVFYTYFNLSKGYWIIIYISWYFLHFPLDTIFFRYIILLCEYQSHCF